jgi:SAM-dependent methyltransferase
MIDVYYNTSRPDVACFLPDTFSYTLEIGCGAGGFTRRYLGKAVERWGIEPNQSAAEAARPSFTHLLCGAYDDVAEQLPDRYFDLVIVNDVIEHMPDHDRFLQDIKRKLAPGGVLVGSVPNVRHFTTLAKLLVAADWPYSDSGVLDRTHLRFFTKKSLRRTLLENGYQIERLEGIRSIIRNKVKGLPPLKNLAVRCAAAALVGITFGAYADTQYPQFGIRVRYLPDCLDDGSKPLPEKRNSEDVGAD